MIRKVIDGVYSVGAVDWNRRLFDELIPLPEGTSYNAYLIKNAEKVALIDTVYDKMENELIKNLKELDVEKIDYVISNHAEGDHSGAIPKILEIYKEAKVVTNQKCKNFLMDMFFIPDYKFITINDRETLSLGSKTLEFIIAPWVHWPETMFTYLKEDKILFTCDFLGSHLAKSGLFVEDESEVLNAAKRYYAEIMMPFRTSIKKHLEKIKDFEIKMIAPSHGPVYDKPEFILRAYSDWVSDNPKNEVVIVYVSMYGNTEKMVFYLLDKLSERGINVTPFNLITTDLGKLAMALVNAATIIIASPTVLVGPHPIIIYGAYLVNVLKPKLKFASIIGSYGWGGKMVEQIKEMLTNIKVEIIEPVMVKGRPTDENFKSLENLAEEIYKKHKELNLN
jgi:flavorubredoxin